MRISILALLALLVSGPAWAQKGGLNAALESLNQKLQRANTILQGGKIQALPQGSSDAPSEQPVKPNAPRGDGALDTAAAKENPLPEVEGPEATDTQLEFSQLRLNDVSSFDVLGFKLGMSLKEANRVARKNKLEAYAGSGTPSFEDQARRIANDRLTENVRIKSDVPRFSRLRSRDGGTNIDVTWIQTAQGVRISKIAFTSSSEGNTTGAIRAQVVSKFGRSTTEAKMMSGDTRYNWCSPNEQKCGYLIGTKQYPTLEVFITANQIQMELDQGYSVRQANENGIKRRADELAAGRAKPVKF